MKKRIGVIISLAVAVMGCATPSTMTGHDPVYVAAADMAVANRGQVASAMTADDVNWHAGTGIAGTHLYNGFDLIAPRTLQPKSQGAPIDFGLKWRGATDQRLGIGLRDQQQTENRCSWVLAPKVALNPDLQLLKNPAFKSDHAQLRVFGISVQLALQYLY
jgi:hypothetical protein